MSICAHVICSPSFSYPRLGTNCFKNAAAVFAPPHLPAPRFLVSAIFELVISFSNAGSSGIGQASSPTSLPASCIRVLKSSSLDQSPVASWPSATTHAPVKVAKSMIYSGSNSPAFQSPSERTSLPSASVFRTSIVLPDSVVITSPGRCALEEGIFSAIHVIATTLPSCPV